MNNSLPVAGVSRRPARIAAPRRFLRRVQSISLISGWRFRSNPKQRRQLLRKQEQSVSIDVPELAELEQVRGRWRSAVAGVLSKSTRRDPAELGDQPEHLLNTPTYDGFAIRPLYTAFDELPEPPLPGEWPYVRGGDALRDVKSGWKVLEAFPSTATAPGDANSALLAALGDGVSAVLIRVGETGVAPRDLAGLLDGVYLSMAPVILDAGADFPAAADALLELVAQV